MSVQCLHKCQADETGRPLVTKDGRAALEVGKTFRFRSGDAYRVQETGAVVRANRKSWRSKAERKAVLRARREDRAALLAQGHNPAAQRAMAEAAV